MCSLLLVYDRLPGWVGLAAFQPTPIYRLYLMMCCVVSYISGSWLAANRIHLILYSQVLAINRVNIMHTAEVWIRLSIKHRSNTMLFVCLIMFIFAYFTYCLFDISALFSFLFCTVFSSLFLFDPRLMLYNLLPWLLKPL